MSPYRRPKREELSQPIKTTTIHIGSVSDTKESLAIQCYDKSIEMLYSIHLTKNEKHNVVFWTSDIGELICVAKFMANNDGIVSFSLDFTESTL